MIFIFKGSYGSWLICLDFALGKRLVEGGCSGSSHREELVCFVPKKSLGC